MSSLPKDPAAIPDYIDHAAATNPQGIWAIVPETRPDGSRQWINLTFSHLGRAVDQMASWIESTIGVGAEGEVIDYMGANDLRYPICIAAALKTRYIPMLTSPRNSVEGQEALFQATKCSKIMYSTELEGHIKEIRRAVHDIRVSQIPSLEELMHPSSQPLPYKGRHLSEEGAVCLVLHTSGSTGLPKPINLTVGGLNVIHTLSSLPQENGQKSGVALVLGDKRPLLAAVPFFHAMGMICAMRSIMCQGTLIRVPNEKVLNASLVIDVINETHPSSAAFPPSVLEDLSTAEEGLKAVSKMDYVYFGGGPLAIESGNKICKRSTLISLIGSTEAGAFANLVPSDPEDWPYFQWSSVSGVEMEEATEGLREMVVKRRDRKYQGIFHTFPDLQEWRTKDLFEEHPTKPGLWKYRGRRDDIIVLSNGEKFNPVSTEKMIEGHPLVKGALVVGQARFQAGLIVEPDWERITQQGIDLDNLIEEVWSLVEQANTEAPAHARIYKSKIAYAKQDKPFKRAGKGSILRFATNTLYAQEIEALYSNEAVSDQLGSLDSNTSPQDVVHFLKVAFSATVPSVGENISDDADIFGLGVDSLGVLSITNMINHALPKGLSITTRVIYESPSISKLESTLSDLLYGKGEISATQSREERMETLLKKYTSDLNPLPDMPSKTAAPSKHVFILTGSTGSLGNYTLELLLQHPEVEKVYCLNRSADAYLRQQKSFSERGVPLTNFDRATFLQTDFAKENFGLPFDVYSDLQQSVTHIIHNAWSVNFNQALESYEGTHIAGTRRLVDFAASAVHRPGIAFVSSIASVGSWSSVQGETAVPETLDTIFDNRLPIPQGYGEGKHVASQILATASRQLGLRTAIVRAGQLAGPSAGYAKERGAASAWNRHEWLPSLIKTSFSLRKIPERLGNQERVDWVPMDNAAGALVDISLGLNMKPAQESNCEVFHLVNPRVTEWSSLIPGIQYFFRETANSELQAVSYSSWLEALKAIPMTKENTEEYPSLKLLDFYGGLEQEGTGLPVLETKQTKESSETLRGMAPVGREDLRTWLEGWRF